MNELLNNPTVQAALVAVVVVALKALATWINSKVSYTAQVNEYWCYIQPVFASALDQAQAAVQAGTWGTAVLRDISTKSLVELADTFRKFEGKEISGTLLAAASDEIEKALAKVSGVK